MLHLKACNFLSTVSRQVAKSTELRAVSNLILFTNSTMNPMQRAHFLYMPSARIIAEIMLPRLPIILRLPMVVHLQQ